MVNKKKVMTPFGMMENHSYKEPVDARWWSEASLVSIREQIQEDIDTYLGDKIDYPVQGKDIENLCQIVVDNFKKLEN